jgi:hypothetical protein
MLSLQRVCADATNELVEYLNSPIIEGHARPEGIRCIHRLSSIVRHAGLHGEESRDRTTQILPEGLMNGIAATVGGSGRQYMFYLDSGFAMKERFWDGTHWTFDWIKLGGIFTSVPAAVATMAIPPEANTGGGGGIFQPEASGAGSAPAISLLQRLDVFGLGLDYAMYHKTLWGAPADNPGAWESLGGIFTSAPAAVALDGHIHVFGLGLDHSMFHKTWNGSAWSTGWERLNGFFSSAASVVSWGPGRLDVFVRGADFTLRHRSFEGNAWSSGWQNLGGSLASPPVAVSWGPNRLDIFAINHDDGAIIHRWWDGLIWNDWEHVAGTKDLAFTSMPAAVTWGPNRLDVFATGSDGALYHVSSVEDAWSQPESFGSIAASTPTVLAPAVNRLDLIAPGYDGNLYHKHWDGTAWQPLNWDQLGDHTRLPSRYRFSIDLIRVLTARSANSDTDTGQCSLVVGNWPTAIPPKNWPFLQKTQSQGDLGGTAVKEGQTNQMNFGPVTVELCEASIFNYTFVNSAADPGLISDTLIKQGTQLADSGVQTVVKDIGAGLGLTVVDVAGVAAPLLGSLLGILSAWLVGELNSIIHARCDGTVAAEQVVTMGKDLQAKTIQGHPFTMTTIHEGTDSPAGCGANSEYQVTWSITMV